MQIGTNFSFKQVMIGLLEVRLVSQTLQDCEVGCGQLTRPQPGAKSTESLSQKRVRYYSDGCGRITRSASEVFPATAMTGFIHSTMCEVHP